MRTGKPRPEDHRIRVTSVFLEDALHGRRSTHRIDATSLTIYRLYYHPSYMAALHAVMLLQLTLVTGLEPPDSCRRGEHYINMWSAVMNLICCIVYIFDAALQARFRGLPYVRFHAWYLVKLLIVLLMACDAMTTFAGVPCQWSRPLRPLLVVSRLVNVRSLFVSILRTIPKILNVAILLLFNLLLFTFLGHEIFRDTLAGKETVRFVTNSVNTTVNVHHFRDLGSSLDALFKLLTTVNFPDVMHPYVRGRRPPPAARPRLASPSFSALTRRRLAQYRESRWSALFFIMYLLVGLFFLSNLLLAVVYQYYRDNTVQRTRTRLRRRFRALQLAFRALSGHLELDSDAVYKMNSEVEVRPQTFRWRSHGASNPLPKSREGKDSALTSASAATPRPDEEYAYELPPLRPDEAASHSRDIPTAKPASARASRGLGSTMRRFRRHRADSTGPANPAPGTPPVASASMSASAGMRRLGTALAPGSLPNLLGRRADPAISSASPYIAAPPTWLITEQQWLGLMAHYRPSVPEEAARIMFQAIDLQRSGTLTEPKFMELCEYIQLDVRLKKSARNPRRTRCQTWKLLLQDLATNSRFVTMFDFLVIVNALIIFFQSFGDSHALEVVSDGLLFVFVIEMLVMVGGLGWKEFARSSFNIIDLLSIALAVVSKLFVYSLDLDVNSRRNRVITLIRIVRLLRVMRVLKQFSSVASALGLMLPVLLRFVGVMLLYFYVFAVIGMESFSGLMTPDRIRTSLYAVNGFYPSNFDDLVNATVTVFQLLVVNNWNIIASGATECCGAGSIVYFIAFYVTAVMIIMNVVVAFVLETFISHWMSLRSVSDVKPWEERLRIAQRASGGVERWRMKRKRRHSDVYKNIFQDELSDDVIRTWKSMHTPGGAVPTLTPRTSFTEHDLTGDRAVDNPFLHAFPHGTGAAET